MPIKLWYFDARGFAEPIRIILHYGGADFQDIRIPLTVPRKVPEDVKKIATWGQIPFVEIDGKKLAQSLAITRYFAKQYKLVPEDDFQAALCDEYVDACRDFVTPWMPVVREQDPEKKMELFAEVEKSVRERFLTVFDSIIKANGGKHLVGDRITWADIYLAHVVTNIEIVFGKSLVNDNDDFPAIKALIETVHKTPKIKEYVEKRPRTEF